MEQVSSVWCPESVTNVTDPIITSKDVKSDISECKASQLILLSTSSVL